jgi:anti-sigma B factor antagonist
MIETNTHADGCVRLRAFGEFSVATAVSLRHMVADSVGQGVLLIIDLRRVECIDAEGVSALVGTVRRARSVGGDAQVVNARSEVEATFELAGVYDMLLGSSTTTDDTA